MVGYDFGAVFLTTFNPKLYVHIAHINDRLCRNNRILFENLKHPLKVYDSKSILLFQEWPT